MAIISNRYKHQSLQCNPETDGMCQLYFSFKKKSESRKQMAGLESQLSPFACCVIFTSLGLSFLSLKKNNKSVWARSACCYRMPLTGRLRNNRNLPLTLWEAGGRRSRLHRLRAGEESWLPGSQQAVFTWVLTGRGKGAGWRRSFRRTRSPCKAPPS